MNVMDKKYEGHWMEMCLISTYPEKGAVKVWREGDAILSVHRSDGVESYSGERGFWYCGYVRFPNCPFRLADNRVEDILEMPDPINSVRVHGGVTYTNSDDFGYVLGWDGNHGFSGKNKETKDLEWAMGECLKMYRNIVVVSKLEPLMEKPELFWPKLREMQVENEYEVAWEDVRYGN
jgi:hypothetical protein